MIPNYIAYTLWNACWIKSIQEDDLDIDFRHYGAGFDIEFEDLS